MRENFQIALPTAFKINEDLDIEKTLEIAKYLINREVKSLLICGSTGEQHSINLIEKIKLLEAFDSFQKQHPQIQIMFGIASTRQKEAVELATKLSYTSLSGSLIGFPPYIIPSQIEALSYIKSIIEASQKPSIIYSNPMRTGFSLQDKYMLTLIQHSLVFGLKLAGKPSSLDKFKTKVDKDFLFYAGGEALLFEKFELGYNAVSSIGGNLYPTFFKSFIDEYFSEEKEKAKESWDLLWQKLIPLYQGSVISNLKIMLKEQGIDAGIPRSPIGNT